MARKYGNRRSEHDFSQVPKSNIQRSVFNRSHTHKTTFSAGKLIPILVDEILPGDTFNVNMTAFARMSTPLYPVMDNLHLDVQFFFCPSRILWDNFQKFMGEQIDPGDSTDYVIPQVTHSSGGIAEELLDYMGIPVGKTNLSINALPFRMYATIWNQFYRDQNLQDSIAVPKDDGPDNLNSFYRYPLRRGKRHDYFTSCLPFVSKGPGVEIPLGDSAPIVGTGIPTFDIGTEPAAVLKSTAIHGAEWSGTPGVDAGGADWNNPNLEVDLGSATAATINTLRQAFQLQKLFERDARGGTRYVEIVKAHFQTSTGDARLQRPEFLGSGSIPINITAVAHTGPQTKPAGPTGWLDGQNRGDLSGYGTAVGSAGFNKSFVEHGYIMGLASVRADLTYQQGVARMWHRNTRYDFYWPALQSIGEQAVLYQEIFYQDHDATSPANTDVWGYQERWAEYRYSPSRISGQFRSAFSTSLDVWHLAQEFDDTVVLGDTFIQETPPLDRVLAVEEAAGAPHIIFDSFFDMKCARPMPVYSVPGLIDHF